MATYYIDPTWVGPANGTLAQPYTTPAQLPTRAAGDFVYFKAGTTLLSQVTHTAANATSTLLSSPVTYGRYGAGDDPIIRSNSWCFDISQPGAVVQDLRFGAVNFLYSSGGVRALNCGEVRVQRCTVEDSCDYGFQFNNTSANLYRNIEVLNNTVLGTALNQGILVIWGSSVGGIYEDILIQGNSITRCGMRSSDTSNGPMGIRLIPRADAMTSGSGTVELNLFSRGVVVERNTVVDTYSFGLAYSGISSGGTETRKNRISDNVFRNNGDGRYDSHVLWVACSRDVLVADNLINGSTMFQGGSSGTGVGIFIDNSSFTSLYNNSKRVRVLRNIVRNTGRSPDGSVGSLELKGAGILVYLSQTIEISDNTVVSCYSGLGVLGWFGAGEKAAAVSIRGNRVFGSVRDGISTVKGADSVALQENYVDGSGGSDIYVENSGAYACTSYTETRNNVSGTAATAYRGGSEPTSTASPAAARTPSAGNLILSPLVY